MPNRPLLAPTAAAGVLMAAYLLLRPYGDLREDPAAVAEAFASPLWIAAHVCGALAPACVAWLAVRLADLTGGAAAGFARRSGLAGAVLVLPYYGAETFGLHALGRAALDGDTAALDLADPIRGQPVAVAMFGAGLLLLAASGIAVALAWQRSCSGGAGRGAAWPLGVMTALLLPQFFLPPAGRIAYGVAYLLAAAVLAAAAYRVRSLRPQRDREPLGAPA